jgi:toxin FitB
MSALLLDTNIPSESIRGRPDPKLDAWIHGQDDKTLHLSFVTIGELRKGALSAQRQLASRPLGMAEWPDPATALEHGFTLSLET